jgi:hypothetical protein
MKTKITFTLLAILFVVAYGYSAHPVLIIKKIKPGIFVCDAKCTNEIALVFYVKGKGQDTYFRRGLRYANTCLDLNNAIDDDSELLVVKLVKKGNSWVMDKPIYKEDIYCDKSVKIEQINKGYNKGTGQYANPGNAPAYINQPELE